MQMDYDLLIDLHKNNNRQGPGGDYYTKLAINLAGLNESNRTLKIADTGCGTGASSLVLAENLDAEITAIDLFDDFLKILAEKAKQKGLNNKISVMASSMDDLPIQEQSLDVIWGEGSIYNIGFEQGVEYFRKLLKPSGIIAVSEITWLTENRPEDISDYWQNEYPQIDTAGNKIRILERHGFMMKGYFPLPESCWIDNYYDPLENSFEDFLKKHDFQAAKEIIETEKHEISIYKKYKKYYSYGFYIAEKL